MTFKSLNIILFLSDSLSLFLFLFLSFSLSLSLSLFLSLSPSLPLSDAFDEYVICEDLTPSSNATVFRDVLEGQIRSAIRLGRYDQADRAMAKVRLVAMNWLHKADDALTRRRCRRRSLVQMYILRYNRIGVLNVNEPILNADATELY